MNRFAIAAALMLAAAVVIAVAAMLHGAGKFEWNLFYVWVLAPYVALAMVFVRPSRPPGPRDVAACVASLAVLAFTAYAYIGAMWFSSSSTSALVFVVVPVYVFVGGLVIWGLAAWILARRASAGSRDG
ncbi:MAG: hypothetical protein JSR18_04360 [Proteobacteria bacterium]|nr:hypothetical protein [Pseudomonadota bacterium]